MVISVSVCACVCVIRAGFAQYNPCRFWKNGTESDVRNW